MAFFVTFFVVADFFGPAADFVADFELVFFFVADFFLGASDEEAALHWPQRTASMGTSLPHAGHGRFGILPHADSVISRGASLRGSIPHRGHVAGRANGASGSSMVPSDRMQYGQQIRIGSSSLTTRS